MDQVVFDGGVARDADPYGDGAEVLLAASFDHIVCDAVAGADLILSSVACCADHQSIAANIDKVTAFDAVIAAIPLQPQTRATQMR